MVYIDKPQFAASSTRNAERLAVTSYNKLMSKAIRQFPIVRAQANTLINDQHITHNTMLISSATEAPRDNRPVNACQRIPVE